MSMFCWLCNKPIPDADAAEHACFREDSGWRPISSAPKDVPVLAFWTRYGGTQNVAQFDGEHWWEVPVNANSYFTAPTHWRPLPETPK